ncbi:hypothetical protein CTAYLR_008583 [Chrysophaeum taylorii]|uniref:Uncharacterized protein n=1 Tax=Chrysophaeum taylorii TaxID=2483200 RepID=A0AAD7XMD8_9STRA|nr:hypothetical protein CTAYLR_008583 [Chrysophaeum taylorii]
MSEDEEENREYFVPPGARAGSSSKAFGRDFDPHFLVPRRLADKPADLIEAVNDFHYAMMNDHPRNDFYRECLRRAIEPGRSVVLEIGTGSGLLAMLAARLGAQHVVAIEASRSLAELARRNLVSNGLDRKVVVISRLSTDVTPEEVVEAAGRLPDVVVSELFGTLLLGESALDYLDDARRRLAAPGARVVPPRGVQYAAIVECEDIAAITSARPWDGFSLAEVNLLQDTASVVFTKQYGFRFSSVKSRQLAPPAVVFEVDFSRDSPGFAGPTLTRYLEATQTGTAHCVLVYWEVAIGAPRLDGSPPDAWECPDRPLAMSTDPALTKSNFARDMQWGQGLQLLEDVQAANLAELDDPLAAATRPPTPLYVQAGDTLELDVSLSDDSVVLQFILRHPDAPAVGPFLTREEDSGSSSTDDSPS